MLQSVRQPELQSATGATSSLADFQPFQITVSVTPLAGMVEEESDPPPADPDDDNDTETESTEEDKAKRGPPDNTRQ